MAGRTITTVALGWVLLVGTGCHDPHPADAEEFNREGLVLMEQGRFVDALGIFKASLKKHRENYQTLYYIGYAYRRIAKQKLQQDDPVAAETCLDLAIYYFDASLHANPVYQNAISARREARSAKESLVRYRLPKPPRPLTRAAG